MSRIEFRMNNTYMSDKGDMIVAGYVNQTGQYSEEMGVAKRFKETIKRGAFKRAIQNSKRDIDFLAEHDEKVVLASTKNGTLQLKEDETGLYMEARILNTSAGRDWYEMISSGLITNMSFGFISNDDEWRSLGSNLYERTINELELFEVSAVRNPAYTQSTIASRGLNTTDEVVPNNIEEDVQMEQRSIEDLFNVIAVLNSEVRALRGALNEKRGTLGVDENEKQVPVQKDNYAVGQQTSEQAGVDAGEVAPAHKVIKADEDVSKYYGNKTIDGEGSYNHDTKVPIADENNVTQNEPESQSGVVGKYDGSLPSEVPGNQNDHVESEVKPKEGTTTTTTTAKPTTTTTTTIEQKSISYDELDRKVAELRGGNV